MTYCVAIKVNEGLVFAGDTRTSAGVDDVRTYNKLHVYEFPGDRVFVVLSAGNLATTQAVLANIKRDLENPNAPVNLRSVRHMYDAAEYIGMVSVKSQQDTAEKMQFGSTVDLRTTLILGGQIQGEEPALYLIYPEGNCISTSPETPYLQIGESKYGKPILDRAVSMATSLEDAARCALVSLDSTMKSNLSVGPPLDLAILPRDALRITHTLRLDLDTPLLAEIREAWGRQLLQAFRNLPRFDWEQPDAQQSLIQRQS
ncbi:MAG: peptidase [Pseudomonadota bacterium]|nr:peptidase [Pseudomonadota bacterium]